MNYIFNPETGAGGIQLKTLLSQETPIMTAPTKKKKHSESLNDFLFGSNDTYVIPAVFLAHTNVDSSFEKDDEDEEKDKEKDNEKDKEESSSFPTSVVGTSLFEKLRLLMEEESPDRKSKSEKKESEKKESEKSEKKESEKSEKKESEKEHSNFKKTNKRRNNTKATETSTKHTNSYSYTRKNKPSSKK